MGKPQAEVEEQEDIFQAILLADNFDLSILGSEWAAKQNPGASRFSDDEDDDKNLKEASQEESLDSKLTQEVSCYLLLT